MALVQQHAVDALRVHPARVLVGGLAVAAWDLRQVGRDDQHLANRPVDLIRRQGEDRLTMVLLR